jgi:hypothetical protein
VLQLLLSTKRQVVVRPCQGEMTICILCLQRFETHVLGISRAGWGSCSRGRSFQRNWGVVCGGGIHPCTNCCPSSAELCVASASVTRAILLLTLNMPRALIINKLAIRNSPGCLFSHFPFENQLSTFSQFAKLQNAVQHSHSRFLWSGNGKQ